MPRTLYRPALARGKFPYVGGAAGIYNYTACWIGPGIIGKDICATQNPAGDGSGTLPDGCILDSVQACKLEGGKESCVIVNCTDADTILLWHWSFLFDRDSLAGIGRGTDGFGSGWSMFTQLGIANTGTGVGPMGLQAACVTTSAGAQGWATSSYNNNNVVPLRWYFCLSAFNPGNGLRCWLDGCLVSGVDFGATTWRSSTIGMKVGQVNGVGYTGAFAMVGWSYALSNSWTDIERQARELYWRTREPAPIRRPWLRASAAASANPPIGAYARRSSILLGGGVH